MENKVIAIACDHAGVEHKKAVIKLLKKQKIAVINHGTDSTESVDYPDFIHPVANSIEAGEAEFGVIICGSGNGVAMTANKHQNIRAAVCWTPELAELARQHNDANVISIPARFVDMKTAQEMVKVFLDTEFEGGRHSRRVRKIKVEH